MANYELYPFQPGEVLTLRKQHPCGSQEWLVLRAGSDIQLRCLGCKHIQHMKRRSLEKVVRKIRPMEPGTQNPLIITEETTN